MHTDKHRFTKITVAAIVVLLGLRAQALAQPCGGYEVTAIIQAPACPPFGPRPTSGYGVSEQGNVVGRYLDCANAYSQAFMWSPETGFVTVPTPPENIMSAASDIEGTRIVGTFDPDGDGLSGLAFLYDTGTGDFTNLGTLPGGTRSEAFAVNTAGQIAGYWGNHVIGPWQTFIWENGEMIDLGPSIGGLHNRGFDINEAGSITGRWRRKESGELFAFLWHEGRMTDLGPIPGGFTSAGKGINIHNQITGWGKVTDPDGGGIVSHPFFWSEGRMIDLGTLPGFPLGWGWDISDAGTIVGQCGGAGQAGFIWKNGVMTDLNELISGDLELHIFEANAINNEGQITGTASVRTGIAAVLLTPILPPIGDLDLDCAVGVSDLLILLASWGPCDNCENCPADLTGDCSVGVADLLLLLANWGPCP